VALINIQAFKERAKRDPEFLRAMRYYDGVVRISVGDTETYDLTFREGKMTGGGPGDVGEATISVKATEEQWSAMLAEYPKPFYHSLQSSAVRHGVVLSGTDATFAYLPALNRMMQILRINHKAG
jgi:hypothetical protein